MEVKANKKLSFFDCLNSINEGSRGSDLFANPSFEEKAYVPFMVNRGLSFFTDTVLFANEVNRRASMPVRAQYEFLRRSIRPRKRFSKWLKHEEPEGAELLKRAYGYSSEKARQVLPLMTDQAMNELRARLDPGGK